MDFSDGDHSNHLRLPEKAHGNWNSWRCWIVLLLVHSGLVSGYYGNSTYHTPSDRIFHGTHHLRHKRSAPVLSRISVNVLGQTYIIPTDEAKYTSSLDPVGWNGCEQHPLSTFYALSSSSYYPIFCKTPNYSAHIGAFGFYPFAFDSASEIENGTDIIQTSSPLEIFSGTPSDILQLQLCKSTTGDGSDIILRCVELMSQRGFTFDGAWSISVDYSAVITKDGCIVCMGHRTGTPWLTLFNTSIPTPLINTDQTYATYWYTSFKGVHYFLSPYAQTLGYVRTKRTAGSTGTGAHELGIANRTLVYVSFSSLVVSSGYMLYDTIGKIPSPHFTAPLEITPTDQCNNGTVIYMAHDYVVLFGKNSSSLCTRPVPMVEFLQRQSINTSDVDETQSLLSWLWDIVIGLLSKLFRFLLNLLFKNFGFQIVYLTLVHWLITSLTGSSFMGFTTSFAVGLYYTGYD